MSNANSKVGLMNKVSCRIFKKKKHVFNTVFASIVAITMSISSAQAAPTGGQVVAGGANIGVNGNTTNVNQNTQNAIINWKGFSTGINEVVNFFNAGGNTLNRVTGNTMSTLLGQVNATGSVYLINENGIVMGPDSSIRTQGSFVASTRDITNNNFMSGGALNFKGNSTAGVTNLGKIASGENVYLVGSDVFNDGMIKAGNNAALIAADEVAIMVNGANGTNYTVVSSGQNLNNSSVTTNPMASAINGASTGSASVINGKIVRNSGTVEAGKNIDVIADRGHTILASGSSLRGSNVNVGGYFQGGNAQNSALPASLRYASLKTTVEDNASIKATNDAVVWADGNTNFSGNLAAENAEISGHNNLVFQTGLNNIQANNLLLDPSDIDIVAGSSTAITSGTATANTLYADDVTNYLNNSGNLSIQTSDTGAGSGDIDVNADVAYNANTLTLRAHNDININKNIDASASTGNSGLLVYAKNDINVADGVALRSGQAGTIELNAATTNPFANSSSAGRVGNWKDGTGAVKFNGAAEIQTKNLAIRSGKDANGDRTDFGTNVTLKNHTGKFGNVQLHGFENVDLNVDGTNADINTDLSLLVNAKNINIDESKLDINGAVMLNAAAFDDTTNDFVEYDGEYNSLGSLNGSGWKENSGTVTFTNATGTEISNCCGTTIQSGKDSSGNRVDLTKDKVAFTYNKPYDTVSWYQVHGFDKFNTTFEGNKLKSNTFVDIQNGENLIDFDVEAGADITSATYNKAGSNGDVLIVADRDTTIAAGTDIVASEDVTIVADEATPLAPGAGKVVMDKTATITSGGNTAFFTSIQAQNDIAGVINGDTFTPGTEFLPTSIEEWLVFYQNKNKFGKTPYKVYYKNAGNPPLPANVDCDEDSGNPACANFVNLIDNRREYRVALSGEGKDIGEEVLAIGSSEDLRNNEFYTALDADYVDNHLNTNERFGLLYSVPLDLVQTSLLDFTIPGIQGIAELIVSPVTSQF